MFNKIENILMPLAVKLGQNKVLIAVRDGFLITTPLVIVGSIFLLFANFPIPGWSEFWAGLFGSGWESWVTRVSGSVFNTVGFFSCLGTAYAYGREKKTDPIQAAAVAVIAFLILTPNKLVVEGVADPISGLSFNHLGTNGIFVGLLTAILSVEIYAYTTKKGWTIKMPDGVPPAVTKSFAALIPSALVMLLFFIINILFGLTAYGTVHDFIFNVLQMPLKGAGNTLTAQLIYSLACTIFWFFGINGPAVANSVFSPILRILTMENLDAFQAGQALPNIFTDPFSNFFTNFGGGGSTLSLVIIMVLFCKSKRIKELGKLSLVPGIFGINEPIIFGLPVVLNPIIIIPFLIAVLFSEGSDLLVCCFHLAKRQHIIHCLGQSSTAFFRHLHDSDLVFICFNCLLALWRHGGNCWDLYFFFNDLRCLGSHLAILFIVETRSA